jgi:hypothetical protein
MSKKIHIGELIRSKLEEEGRSAAWLTKRIPCSRGNIYKIFEMQDIHPKQLYSISVAMKFDFFSCYSEMVCEEF